MNDERPGTIRLFAGDYAPAGWATCDGSLRSVADDGALFKAIGTTYGGDGKEKFALPNLQSQVPVHVPNGGKLGQLGKGNVTLPEHAATLRYIKRSPLRRDKLLHRRRGHLSVAGVRPNAPAIPSRS